MVKGRKDDAGKLRYDLLPVAPLRAVVGVLTHGAARYGADNWRAVPDAPRRYYAAAMRHLEAWRAGDELDPDSGLPHLAHAACSVLFLLGGGARPESEPEPEPQRFKVGDRVVVLAGKDRYKPATVAESDEFYVPVLVDGSGFVAHHFSTNIRPAPAADPDPGQEGGG